MKEATGEANMTIITVVLITVVAAVGAFLIPNLLKSTTKKSCCTSEGGQIKGGQCVGSDGAVIDISSCINEGNNGAQNGTATEG